MEKLAAEQYRQAMVLVLTVLVSLDPTDVTDTAERLGHLQAHVRTIAGLGGDIEPRFGLAALRGWVEHLVDQQ